LQTFSTYLVSAWSRIIGAASRGYKPSALLAKLKKTMPEARPLIEYGDQGYVHDPDGAKVQFADVTYKR
jgi:hypothetical protein